MRSTTAHATANMVLLTAGAAAAAAVIATPPLRRLAIRAARVWLGVTVPAYLLSAARQAWVESGSGLARS